MPPGERKNVCSSTKMPSASPLSRVVVVVVVVVVVGIDAQAACDSTVATRHLVNWREAARSSEWAQHFSNASCFFSRCIIVLTYYYRIIIRIVVSTAACQCCYSSGGVRSTAE